MGEVIYCKFCKRIVSNNSDNCRDVKFIQCCYCGGMTKNPFYQEEEDD